MHETGFSGLVHWDDPEGWDGEGGFKMGNTCTPMADSCEYIAKITTILITPIKIFFKVIEEKM